MNIDPQSLRCSNCTGRLHASTKTLDCEVCGTNFPIAKSIVDLRLSENVNRKSSVGTYLVNQGIENCSWPELVREITQRSDTPGEILYHTTVDGRCAWRLFIDHIDNFDFLDINCGTGLVSQNLAVQARRVTAVDQNITALEIAAKRFAHCGTQDKTTLIACEDYSALPFPDNSFDLISMSFPPDDAIGETEANPASSDSAMMSSAPAGIDPPSLRPVLNEIRRLLRPEGQLVLIGQSKRGLNPIKLSSFLPGALNRKDSRHPHPDKAIGHSFSEYTKALKKAGLRPRRTLGLLRGHSFLHQISALDGMPNIQREHTSGALKSRIRESRFFVPAFAFIAAPKSGRSRSTLDRLLSEVAEELQISPADIKASDISISRKEKLIVRASAGEHRFMLRVPLNRAALQSEKNNAAMLDYLQKNRGNTTVTFPRPILQGTLGPTHYFVETFASGAPLAGAIRTADPNAMIRSVESLLGQLNPEPGAAETVSLTGHTYDRAIDQRVKKLGLALRDIGIVDRISGYFSDHLKGVRLPAGILHGDFSASNILMAELEICGLIDWEGGSNKGLAILDAINYVDSTCRLLSGKMVGETIPSLASGHFVDPVYEEFMMKQYARWQIDPDYHEALVYLRWLRHISYLLDFWLLYDERAINRFILPVVDSLLRGKSV